MYVGYDPLPVLGSLLDCHAAEFSDPSLSRLRLEPNAVCLEHLLTWLPALRVVSRAQDKLLLWARDAPEGRLSAILRAMATFPVRGWVVCRLPIGRHLTDLE